MISFDVQNSILRGKLKQEDPEDVFYICITAALISVRNTRERSSSPPRASRTFNTVIDPTVELMGKIFCPIYDVIKPDGYVEEMEKTRLSFSGIVTSTELQEIFSRQVLELDRDRMLVSLERAVEADIWRFLGPPSAKMSV